MAKMPRRPSGRKVGRPRGSLTTARTDLALFSQLHRGQARIWRKRQLVLQREVEALAVGETMSEALTVELQRIDAFLSKSSSAMVTVQEATEASYAELPTEQLEAQMAAEFVAAARTYTPAQWALIDREREKWRGGLS